MEFLLNPDKERMNLTLVMGLLVNGSTVLDDFAWAFESELFAIALKKYGLNYSIQGHQLVLEGKGFQFLIPPVLDYSFQESENVLLWTLASKDTEQLYTFFSDDSPENKNNLCEAKEVLQRYFKIKIFSDSPTKFVFSFENSEPNILKNSLGNVSYLMRNRMLLRALIRGEYLSFEEKFAVHDQWTKMLMYFGANVKYEGRGMEQLSEFERRLMMAQGKKIERTLFTELSETNIITGREYFVPRDTTEALAIALLVTIGNIPKENKVKLLNVELNSSKSGAFTCLKRMGANIETITRREKFGDVFGDIEVHPLKAGKRLQGRRFNEEIIATSLSEYSLLAVAACYAEGETILRLPQELCETMHPLNIFLAQNLSKTGVEIGVYEEGIVIRGMETIISGNGFDCGNYPEIGLALSVLSFAIQNDEPIEHADIVEKNYPGIIEKLRMVLIEEHNEL